MVGFAGPVESCEVEVQKQPSTPRMADYRGPVSAPTGSACQEGHETVEAVRSADHLPSRDRRAAAVTPLSETAPPNARHLTRFYRHFSTMGPDRRRQQEAQIVQS